MKSLPKAIFIDVDGTLCNHAHEVSARNQKALRLAQRHGIETVVCTGRPCGYALELCRSAGSGNYCICCNGAGVLDIKQNKLLYKSLIPPELTLKACELSENLPGGEEVFWNFECSDAHYLSRVVPEHMNGKIAIPEALGDFLNHHEVMQLVACHETDIPLMRTLRQKVIDANFGLKVTNQQKHMINPAFPPVGIPYFDLNLETISKGTGIREFCKIMDFSPEDCVAIGDDDNDLDMFEACGLGVAVGNALPEVLARADIVVADNEHDGVAELIEQILIK